MLDRIARGVPVGLLGYREDGPVGWVSVAPRDTYRDLGGPAARHGETIWSVACIYVPQGPARRGTVAATAESGDRPRGRSRRRDLEAYPVDPDSPSYRFMGFVPAFESLGFTEIGTAGSRRHVMRLTI